MQKVQRRRSRQIRADAISNQTLQTTSISPHGTLLNQTTQVTSQIANSAASIKPSADNMLGSTPDQASASPYHATPPQESNHTSRSADVPAGDHASLNDSQLDDHIKASEARIATLEKMSSLQDKQSVLHDPHDDPRPSVLSKRNPRRRRMKKSAKNKRRALQENKTVFAGGWFSSVPIKRYSSPEMALDSLEILPPSIPANWPYIRSRRRRAVDKGPLYLEYNESNEQTHVDNSNSASSDLTKKKKLEEFASGLVPKEVEEMNFDSANTPLRLITKRQPIIPMSKARPLQGKQVHSWLGEDEGTSVELQPPDSSVAFYDIESVPAANSATMKSVFSDAAQTFSPIESSEKLVSQRYSPKSPLAEVNQADKFTLLTPSTTSNGVTTELVRGIRTAEPNTGLVVLARPGMIHKAVKGPLSSDWSKTRRDPMQVRRETQDAVDTSKRFSDSVHHGKLHFSSVPMVEGPFRRSGGPSTPTLYVKLITVPNAVDPFQISLKLGRRVMPADRDVYQVPNSTPDYGSLEICTVKSEEVGNQTSPGL